MTPQEALIELLARVGARNGAAVLVSAEELNQWPAAAVAAMKSQKLLARARPAVSVVCPGCERECVMPVHTVRAGPRGPASFIVCDKRDDINRVSVSADRLMQWRCDADAVCGFVAASSRLAPQRSAPCHCRIAKYRHHLRWQAQPDAMPENRRPFALVVGNGAVPLAELVSFRNGEYSVDGDMIRQLVDSATTANPRSTPSNARREARKLDTQAMYEAWRKAYRDLNKKRRNMTDVWYSQQIAKQGITASRSAETIRKHIKT